MSHEPEKDAASYLGGEMSRRYRRRFEQHILECDDCWREVHVGRRGRIIAESGRELAPQFLRERVRASIESLAPRGSRFGLRVTGIVALVLLLAVSVPLLLPSESEQPVAIDAILSDFSGEQDAGRVADPALPSHLGDLELRESKTATLGGLDVIVHVYEDAAGHVVSVYQADEAFPIADGAHLYEDAAGTWTANVEDAVLFCTEHPIPSLIVGDDTKEVKMAAQELDLHVETVGG